MTTVQKGSATAEVARFCVERGLDAEVVGAWVWVSFPSKPSAEVRAELKASGFRWVHRRGQWAHNCGVRSRKSNKPNHPREFYGSVPVEDVEATA